MILQYSNTKELYDQGDIMYSCEDAGKQWVAMSLSALIYNAGKTSMTGDCHVWEK